MKKRAWFLGLVGGSLLACELVVDTQGLTGGAASVPGADGKDGGGADGAIESGPAVDGGDGGAPADGATCTGTWTYCNSFEKDPDLLDWAATDLTASIDKVDFQRGAGALKLVASSAKRVGIWAYAGAIVIPQPHLFVRFLTKENGGTLLFFGKADYSDGVQVYIGGDGAYHAQQYNGADVFTNIFPDRSLWHCVEAELDESQNKLNTWFDGDGPHSVALVGASFPYELLTLNVAETVVTARYDELVFDTKRIGCP